MSSNTLSQIAKNSTFKKKVSKEVSKKSASALFVEGVACPHHFGPGIWPYIGLGTVMNTAHEKVVHGAEFVYEAMGVENAHHLGHETVEYVGLALLLGIGTKFGSDIYDSYKETRSDLEERATTYIQNNPGAAPEEAMEHIDRVDTESRVGFKEKLERFYKNPGLVKKVYFSK